MPFSKPMPEMMLPAVFLCLLGAMNCEGANEAPGHEHSEPTAKHHDHKSEGAHDSGHHDEHESHADNDHHDKHDGEHDDEHSDEEHDEHNDEHNDDHHGEHDGEDHGEASGSVGPNKAILEADRETGILIAPAVMDRFKIQFRPLREFASGPGFLIPDRFVVRSENRRIVYIRSGGRVRPIIVGLASTLLPAESKVSEDDELVVSQLPLVHLAYIEAFGASGSGHAH